jgi:hypothetical protein
MSREASVKTLVWDVSDISFVDLDVLASITWWYTDHIASMAIDVLTSIDRFEPKMKGYDQLLCHIDESTDLVIETQRALMTLAGDKHVTTPEDKTKRSWVVPFTNNAYETAKRVLESPLVVHGGRDKPGNYFGRIEQILPGDEVVARMSSVARLKKAFDDATVSEDDEDDEADDFEGEQTQDVQIPARNRGGVRDFEIGEVVPTMLMPRGKQ